MSCCAIFKFHFHSNIPMVSIFVYVISVHKCLHKNISTKNKVWPQDLRSGSFYNSKAGLSESAMNLTVFI